MNMTISKAFDEDGMKEAPSVRARSIMYFYES